MKKLCFCSLLFITSWCAGQRTYWQQQVDVNISVLLDDITHSLDGFETIEYTNNSPDTLTFIWFHLWPNAYKNDRTAFSEQLLQNGRTDFYFSGANKKGYINRLDFKADNQAVEVINSPEIDVVKLMLPKPLLPGASTTITTPFHVQLPRYFSRSGHVDNNYQVTQWYPKPAVYDALGWHPMSYLDQGEFYSDFGDFDVEITVPSQYKVAATGVLQNNAMLTALKAGSTLPGEGAKQIWHFKQQQVHDFAWFASKNFTVRYDTAQLPSGKKVDLFSFHKKESTARTNSLAFAKDGLRYYSRLIGDYPYSTFSIVEGPENYSSGGMEYPSITLITTADSGRILDGTIVHELGHNWFYGALANNERKHGWLDEGLNTYYQMRYEKAKYGSVRALQQIAGKLGRKLPADEEKLLLETVVALQKDQPIETPAEQMSSTNYGLMLYKKAPLWMEMLEAKVGQEQLDKAMQFYYSQWMNKHPNPNDFRRSLEEFSGITLNNEFELLAKRGPLSLIGGIL